MVSIYRFFLTVKGLCFRDIEKLLDILRRPSVVIVNINIKETISTVTVQNCKTFLILNEFFLFMWFKLYYNTT